MQSDLRAEQGGRPHGRGGHAAQDAAFAVAGEHGRHRLETGHDHGEQDGHGDVQVDDAAPAEGVVVLPEGRDQTEDRHEYGGEGEDPEQAARFAEEEPGLGPQDREHRAGGGGPGRVYRDGVRCGHLRLPVLSGRARRRGRGAR